MEHLRKIQGFNSGLIIKGPDRIRLTSPLKSTTYLHFAKNNFLVELKSSSLSKTSLVFINSEFRTTVIQHQFNMVDDNAMHSAFSKSFYFGRTRVWEKNELRVSKKFVWINLQICKYFAKRQGFYTKNFDEIYLTNLWLMSFWQGIEWQI